ncbi:hypothetical protein D3C81_1876870 [compost metagenome]
MEKYTKAEMREYVSGEVEDGALALLLFRTCETPGQVKYLLEFGDDAVDDLMELTEKVAYSIDKANAANVFKISTQFRLDDIDLFMSFLRLHLSDMFQKAYPKSDKKTMHRVIEMQRVISHNEGLFKNKGLNKTNLFEMFLIELREAAMS